MCVAAKLIEQSMNCRDCSARNRAASRWAISVIWRGSATVALVSHQMTSLPRKIVPPSPIRRLPHLALCALLWGLPAADREGLRLSLPCAFQRGWGGRQWKTPAVRIVERRPGYYSEFWQRYGLPEFIGFRGGSRDGSLPLPLLCGVHRKSPAENICQFNFRGKSLCNQ